MSSKVELDKVLHDNLCAITGLGTNMVRPMYQSRGAGMPSQDTNWIAFYVTDARTIGMWRGGMGDTVPLRQEAVLQLIIYGPRAWDLATEIEMAYEQDEYLTPLLKHGVAIMFVRDKFAIPQNINNVWVQRIDMKVDLSIIYEKAVTLPEMEMPIININLGSEGNNA